jgi:hypothetical protein
MLSLQARAQRSSLRSCKDVAADLNVSCTISPVQQRQVQRNDMQSQRTWGKLCDLASGVAGPSSSDDATAGAARLPDSGALA